MTEEQRIESLKVNGGLHLKTFSEENRTYNVCLAAVKETGAALEYVPEDKKTYEMCFEAAKRNGDALRFVPQEHIKEELIMAAVKHSGMALQYIPDKMRTREVCLIAAASASEAYKFIPEDLINAEFVLKVAQKSGFNSISNLPKEFKKTDFYLELVKRDGHFIWFIPKNKLNTKICNAAIKNLGFESAAEAIKEQPRMLSRLPAAMYDHDTCLNFVQSEIFQKTAKISFKDLKTNLLFNREMKDTGLFYINENYEESYSLPSLMKWEDVAFAILRKDGRCIKYADPSIITEKLCKCAVESAADAFRFVPEEFKTTELCTLALSKDAYNIRFFPEKEINEDIAKQAVKDNGRYLEYVPVKLRTKELCLLALQNFYGAVMEDIPPEILDKEVCLTWLKNVKQPFRPLSHIPSELLDYDVCLAAVSVYGEDLEKVPAELIDKEMCTVAVKDTSYAVKYVPENLFTEEEMANMIIDNNINCFEQIPQSVLTQEMCIRAFQNCDKRYDKIFSQIPDKFITQEMVDKTIDYSIYSYHKVPERFVTVDMMIRVAMHAPYKLAENFPERFRTKEVFSKITEVVPGAATYIKEFIEE